VTDLPYRDDCNESELYSRESFTENWTGDTETEVCWPGSEIQERLDNTIKEREEIVRQNGLMFRRDFYDVERAINDGSNLPYFNHWILYDKLQQRIYAHYEDNEELLSAIKSDQFPVLLKRIALDRELAFSETEINFMCDFNDYRWDRLADSSIVFLMKDFELYPTARDEQTNIPTEWNIRRVERDSTSNAISGLEELNPVWEQESKYPF
jgi:hypothetical protein